MKRQTITLKEFCMRYPISETVYKNSEGKELTPTVIYSRSLLYENFRDGAEISYNELTIKEEEDYYKKVDNKKANNDIFEMLDIEIDGKKSYGANSCLNNLTRKQFAELTSAVRNFQNGIIAM